MYFSQINIDRDARAGDRDLSLRWEGEKVRTSLVATARETLEMFDMTPISCSISSQTCGRFPSQSPVSMAEEGGRMRASA